MASAQVDRMSRSATSDLTGKHPGAEHVASGSFPPTTDANLLREAALRSLRARKQTATRPQTPITPAQPIDDVEPSGTIKNAVDLDGDVQMDETTAESAMTATPGTPTLSVATEDGEILEDGQISDTGGESTPGPEKPEKTPRPSSDQGDKQDDVLSEVSTVEPPSGFFGMLSPEAERSRATSESSQYVRPSLKMTAADLDEAKRLILDLLGLGVKPEYLVDCGISPQCLAVCFYELNLRFPLNLDRRQVNLPPIYDLDKHMNDSLRRVQIIRQRDSDRASPKSPSLATTPLEPLGSPAPVELSTYITKKPLLPTSSSLPPKPILPPPQSSEHGKRPINLELAVAQSKAAARLPPTGPRAMREGLDAATIEDQRRMELLARKAAMDSITRKRAAKSSPNPSLADPNTPSAQLPALEIQDVDSAVDALLADVRLNSVSVSEQTEVGSSKGSSLEYDEDDPRGFDPGTEEVLADYDSDAMVEDELHAPSPSYSDADADEKTVILASSYGAVRNLSPNSMSPDVSAPLQLPKSPSIPPSARVRFDTPSASGSYVQPSTVAVPVAARKSRPIASDFIDQTPPRSSAVLAKEPEQQAQLKRKRSFVDPQVWPRRLVIDLDSSDEEDEEEVTEGLQTSTSGTSASSRGSVERGASGNGGNNTSSEGGRDLAAQMLLEKELQIKAMMQKIKMREMKRKKTGSASGTGTPVLAAASIVPVVAESMVPQTPPVVHASVAVVSASPDALSGSDALPEGISEQDMVPQPSERPEEQEVKSLEDHFVSTSGAMDLESAANPLSTSEDKSKVLETEVTVEDDQDANMDDRAAARIPSLDTISGSINGLNVFFQVAQNQATQPEAAAEPSKEGGPTHFKAYSSPLAGFTSPSLQPPKPTDQQLPTLYWISSAAGRKPDTGRQLCQYEFPSGICKDQGCPDIHAKDLKASGEDILTHAAVMFPNIGPSGLFDIVTRIRQSTEAQ